MPKITIDVPEGHEVKVVPCAPVVPARAPESALAVLARQFPGSAVRAVQVVYTDYNTVNDRFMADEHGHLPGTKEQDRQGILVAFEEGEPLPLYTNEAATAIYVKEVRNGIPVDVMVAWLNDRLLKSSTRFEEQITDHCGLRGFNVFKDYQPMHTLIQTPKKL